ncbi:MAG: TraB/GumN family protein [Firmicutes bacterium]|nr:TraB/GumN family protein [Bacillota bacterium]
MRKKLLTIVTALIAILVFAVNVYAEDIAVTVDGQPITFPDQGPILVEGRTLVPVRFVFEAMGFVVQWEAETETAVITRDSDRIRITIGSSSFTTNGVRHDLDVPAKNISGRILVPLRLPLESLGYRLNWDAAINTAVVSSPVAAPQLTLTPPVTSPGIHGGIHRIQHAGSVAYIFGSLHGGMDDWFPLANVVEDAMRRADVFAFEVDLSLTNAQINQIRNNIARLPQGQTISDILCENLYEHYMYTLESWAAVFGRNIPERAYTTNPAYMVFSLTQMLEASLENLAPQTLSGTTVDGYIWSFARQNRLPTLGLMDFEEQHRVFLAPPQEIMEYIVQSFSSLEETRTRLENEIDISMLINYYANNDAEGLMRVHHPNFSLATETVYERYIREIALNYRSTLFANEIVRIMEEADEPIVLFVTVGKSHLIRHIAGPEFTSTIEQLRLMGIEVTPLY